MSSRVYMQTGATGNWTPVTLPVAGMRWRDALEEANTFEVTLDGVLSPLPDRILLCPTARTPYVASPALADSPAVVTMQAPVYGPFEVVSVDYGKNPPATILRGQVAYDLQAEITDGASPILYNTLTAQVTSWVGGAYEPFKTWDSAPEAVESTPPRAQVGDGELAYRAITDAYNMTDVRQINARLGMLGLAVRPVVWPTNQPGNAWAESLEVWPAHPLATGANPSAPTPRVAVVGGWGSGRPTSFATTALLNRPAWPAGSWQEAFPIKIPDVHNHHVGQSRHPTFRTRLIRVGYRLLGTADTITLALPTTGGRSPAMYLDPTVGIAAWGKFAEEVARWELQNNAVTWQGVRFPGDEWTSPRAVALSPMQVLYLPAAQLPDGWPDAQRFFTIRAVDHSYDPTFGYQQRVTATLWQGGFERVT